MTSITIYLRKPTSNAHKISGAAVAGLLLMGVVAHTEVWGMGGNAGKKLDENIAKARPTIQQRADAILTQLGYDPKTFVSWPFFTGEGEETWTVSYWHTTPQNAATKGDLEVYLNVRGEVKRVAKFEQGQEQLIYGKDERIPNGFTPAQVRERLGEPDHIGPPPRDLRDICDEMWTYKASPNSRTMRIEVYFKGGKVYSSGYFGE